MGRPQAKPTPRHTAPKASSRSFWAKTGLAGVLIIMIGCLGYWSWNSSRPVPSNAPSPSPELASTPPLPQSTEVPSPQPSQLSFRELVGAWVRPDGGYILEIKSADDSSGKLEAFYFNPQPIHVGQAEAARDGGALRVMVRLQDVNYPGSTYTLTYDPATDQLIGNYFQAIQRVNFPVAFERRK